MAALIFSAYEYESWGRNGNHRTERWAATSSGASRSPCRPTARADDRWRSDLLGPTRNTLGAEGCVRRLGGHGAGQLRLRHRSATPQTRFSQRQWRLHHRRAGFIGEKAAELAGGHVRHAYEDLPSYDLIDEKFGTRKSGDRPAVACLRGVTHFVVIAGKQGFDYLTRDPGAGASKGAVFPLRVFGSRIEAAAFLRKASLAAWARP